MKIAVTADFHLTTIDKYPERYQALSDILGQCKTEGVQLLIIAGDLFDKTMANYRDFEQVYQRDRPDGLRTIIIPGNHDQKLNPNQISGDGLAVYKEAVLKPLNDSRKILFLPYQSNQTMGEAIAPFEDQLRDERWILIGHGDWTNSQNTPDPYEKGSYMPLTRTDLVRYQPELVFLGHVHLHQRMEPVYYPGSPCPINITETGPRKFLILDTAKGQVLARRVNSILEYYDEKFVMVPGRDELKILLHDMKKRIKGWDIPQKREKYLQVRVEISGTAITGRSDIIKVVKKIFSPYRFFRDQDPILNHLYHDPDPDKAAISQAFRSWLESLSWNQEGLNPGKDLILIQGLKTIYGVDQ